MVLRGARLHTPAGRMAIATRVVVRKRRRCARHHTCTEVRVSSQTWPYKRRLRCAACASQGGGEKSRGGGEKSRAKRVRIISKQVKNLTSRGHPVRLLE